MDLLVITAKGRKSNYYLDKYLFETQPDILKALGEMFTKYVGEAATLIAGAELGGVALAASTSMASGKPFVIIRNTKKDYGTSKPYEGKLSDADSVLLVEDIANQSTHGAIGLSGGCRGGCPAQNEEGTMARGSAALAVEALQRIIKLYES